MAESTLNIQVPGPDDLISGNIRTQPVPVAAETYARGEVLGLTGNVYGKLTAAADAAAVMPFDLTLDAETVQAVYIAGDFNQDALELNGQALADVKTALRERGIMVREWGAAPDAA